MHCVPAVMQEIFASTSLHPPYETSQIPNMFASSRMTWPCSTQQAAAWGSTGGAGAGAAAGGCGGGAAGARAAAAQTRQGHSHPVHELQRQASKVATLRLARYGAALALQAAAPMTSTAVAACRCTAVTLSGTPAPLPHRYMWLREPRASSSGRWCVPPVGSSACGCACGPARCAAAGCAHPVRGQLG